MANDENKDDLIKEASDRLQELRDYWKPIYDEFTDDLKFAVDGQQWKPGDMTARGEKPTLTINRMGQFINQVINSNRQNTPTIKVLPVDDEADIKTAELIQDLIRNIEKVSKADTAYDTAMEYAVQGGIGFIRIDHDYVDPDSFEQHILIKRVHDPRSCLIDNMSVEPDGRDANDGFIIEEMRLDTFKEQYPKADARNFDDMAMSKTGFAASDKMITVAEYFKRVPEEKEISLLDDGSVLFSDDLAKREGQYTVLKTRMIQKNTVKRYKMTGAEILEETEFPSSYIPIIPVYGKEIWIDGKRKLYSLIRHAKDAQKMHNFWASLETELIMEAPRSPWVVDSDTIADFNADWVNPAKKKVLKYKGTDVMGKPTQRPFREPPTPIPAAVVNARMATVEDMKATMGMYDPSLGNERTGEKSGRAILATQQQGDTATFHFGDNLARSVGHGGVIILDMLPRVFDTPRILRILGEDGTPKRVPVNGQLPTDPNDQSAINSRNQLHDLRVGKYDVAVITGPGYATKRQEGAQALMELSKTIPLIGNAAPDMLVESLDIPNAGAIAKRVKRGLSPQLTADEDTEQTPEVMQLQGALQQMQAQMQAMGAELQQAQQDLQNKNGELALKNKDLQIKEMQVQLEAMKHRDAMMGQSDDRSLQVHKIDTDAQAKIVTEKIKADASIKASDNQTFAQMNTPIKEPAK
ncbi:hypothetical protein J0X19_11745 [Hymenobacter sp. BT186]|uniref:Phage portal protein n=1 Tax=Hymenobacter telluris TaxID=2816474 RepID=A0A939EW62_9BACT|nr:portal protein [Hymenobacter telluris]MBO0358620.1 hypothetical protein [Hymenobacter telluris]MBW3374646.1 hypothetical protein [Hymenobacter norwichensis]